MSRRSPTSSRSAASSNASRTRPIGGSNRIVDDSAKLPATVGSCPIAPATRSASLLWPDGSPQPPQRRARMIEVGRQNRGHGHDDGHAAPAVARCRQPRPDPRAGRAREQPQGRQRRDPEAPPDGVHRRLGLGQELAGLRHDRRRVAADDQRDLQRLRPGLHADPGPAGRRRPRRADDGDHRRPGADGCQRPLHGRHRHRRQRDAAHPVQPARAAAHRLVAGVLVQRRLGPRIRRAHGRSRVWQQGGERELLDHRGHVSALRGHGLGDGLRPDRPVRRQQVAQRGCAHDPGLQHGRLVRPHLQRRRLLRPRQADPRVHEDRAPRPALQGADEDQGRGHQPHLRRPDPEDPEVDAVQGRRSPPAAHPCLRRAGGDVHHLSRVRRHAAQRGCPVVADQGHQHRRRLRDADQRPRRLDPGPRRADGGALAHGAAADPRRVRGDRAWLPQPRPGVGDAVGRRGAAHQDDPPPRLVAHRRHLRLRRADDRAASPRHPADERAPAAAAGQGQHRPGRRAQAGGDRHRRPRRRPRPRCRHGRWGGRVRGRGGWAAGQWHHHRAAPGRSGLHEVIGPNTVWGDGRARGQHQQPAGRRRRHPARRAGGRDRRGRVGQELADPRLGGGPGRRRGDRPGRDQGLTAQQPGDIHRTARSDPDGVRQGQRREAGACSARTPRAPAPTATAPASSIPTWR